jgi:hypothetical protein
MLHKIKCWPEYYQPLYIGTKGFEVRINDREYRVGDSLFIQEWNPETKEYTGRTMVKRITYLIQGIFGLPENICVMQLR